MIGFLGITLLALVAYLIVRSRSRKLAPNALAHLAGDLVAETKLLAPEQLADALGAAPSASLARALEIAGLVPPEGLARIHAARTGEPFIEHKRICGIPEPVSDPPAEWTLRQRA